MEKEPPVFFWIRNLVVLGAFLFLTFKLATFRGLPNVLVTMGILIVIYAFVTENTVLGRRIYALGGNLKAAKLSGIKTSWLTFLAFVNMGVLSALAGLIYAARLNTATPKTVPEMPSALATTAAVEAAPVAAVIWRALIRPDSSFLPESSFMDFSSGGRAASGTVDTPPFAVSAWLPSLHFPNRGDQ